MGMMIMSGPAAMGGVVGGVAGYSGGYTLEKYCAESAFPGISRKLGGVAGCAIGSEIGFVYDRCHNGGPVSSEKC